ncbi:LysR family transcriptional regulator [Streptomyces caniscabiei]|uniref:LysR family transcriptional regulator n=1 Tax=Streptomyces caniscabiei TaxID=2746961 RepID=A0ABU4N1A6_9ACTN|nr:LysR family transcriptional regulator [Streptomyces caniscabiei]MBE4734018.1 LysR family transcriptional regulator [Streptomyces caniscabiei]MBE4762402.1 LysR family transcriptional regulator [Streptomyces caniscabiei]MBE4769125.1 LysR family transcriptional regulator [Streptomyces caniscabiei]MBE4782741.1 LysR family transcriptional regulator [Streptomyces caniscabiei]MBE4792044.1 LysR family transcriptional regulator [Streptomyces caniscabiei]
MSEVNTGVNSNARPTNTATGLYRVDLNLLPLLAALLEYRSVTRAAQVVGLTQPAMSNALQRLRRTLGDELLVRVGRHYVLTARAAALAGPVSLILDTATNQVLTPPAFDPATSERTFRIAATSATALTVLPALSATLAGCAPGVRLHLEPPDSSRDLTRGDATADVTLLPDTVPTTLPRERLYHEDWVVVADANNDRIGETLTLDDLARLPHVVFEWNGGQVGAQQALAQLLPDLHVQCVVFDFLMIPPMVSGTPVIALLQRRLARRVTAQHGLRVMESPIPLPSLGIDLVWNPRTAGDPGRIWFRKQLMRAVH